MKIWFLFEVVQAFPFRLLGYQADGKQDQTCLSFREWQDIRRNPRCHRGSRINIDSNGLRVVGVTKSTFRSPIFRMSVVGTKPPQEQHIDLVYAVVIASSYLLMAERI
jgi:hypothetical protein